MSGTDGKNPDWATGNFGYDIVRVHQMRPIPQAFQQPNSPRLLERKAVDFTIKVVRPGHHPLRDFPTHRSTSFKHWTGMSSQRPVLVRCKKPPILPNPTPKKQWLRVQNRKDVPIVYLADV